MSDYGMLGQLPVELLHSVFNYFSTTELLYTFHDVNDYVNASLQSYCSYQLNFQGISKYYFDRICRHVRPDQVISLILSDGNNTSGLSDLFFSHFPGEQFTRLRSLTLLDIECDSLKSIFDNLHKFRQLHALSFDDQFIRYQYSSQGKDVPPYLTHMNMDILSQMDRLELNSGAMLTSMPFPYLRHLKLQQCSSDDMQTIFQHAPHLKSLDIWLTLHPFNSDIVLPSNQLTKLDIATTNSSTSMDQMENLLSQFSHLQHLNLVTWGDDDLVDGYRWQTLTNSLRTFNFVIYVSFGNVDSAFDSFCTSFWVEEKRWFVAQEDDSIFSVPYYASGDIDISQSIRTRSTAPTNTFLYDYVNKIIIKEEEIKQNHYFNNVQTLELECTISLQALESTMNLHQIKHLIVPSLDDLLLFLPLQDKMRQLKKLNVKNPITIAMIKQMKSHRFDQILKLEISISDVHTNYIIEELFRLFSFINLIKVENYDQSEKTMIHLIDGFKHLSNASFHVNSSYNDLQSSLCQNKNTIVQHSLRLTPENFTCRIYHSSDNNLLYNWWIDKYQSTCSRKISWLLKRGYHWYRYKYLFDSLSPVKLALVEFVCITLLICLMGSSYAIITGKSVGNIIDFFFNCIVGFYSGCVLTTLSRRAFSGKPGDISYINIIGFVFYFVSLLQVVVPEFSITKLVKHYMPY